MMISQIASLLVTIYFIPMLASRQKLKARDEGGDAKPWRSFSSWREFTEKRRATRKPLLYFAMPWFVLRLVVAFVLELIGKLLLVIVAGLLWLLARLLKPAGAGISKVLLAPIVRMNDAFFNYLGRTYPHAIN